MEELYEKTSASKSYIFEWVVILRFLATTIPTLLILFIQHFKIIKEFFESL